MLAFALALAGLVVVAGGAGATPGASRGTAVPSAGTVSAGVQLLANPFLTATLNTSVALGATADASSPAGGALVTDSRSAFTNVGVNLLGIGIGVLNATAVDRTATATGSTGSATATQSLAGVSLLSGLVGVGALQSSCSITPSASSSTATVTGLTVGGAAVSVVRGGPTVTVQVGTATVGVRLAAGSETTVGGVQTVTSDTLVVGVTGSLDLALVRLTDLSVALTLGASTCTAPTPASTLTSITPATGPDTGGQAVTLTGTGFSGATGVTVGGTPATSFTVVNDTTITAVTPAGPVGSAAVVVVDPEGNGTLAAGYTYLATPPLAGGLTPTAGPDGGGTRVTISGTGFTGVDTVTFGGTPGTAVTVVSDTQLQVTTPAGTAGATVPVVVSQPGLPSSTATSGFTYTATVPDLVAVTPGSGPDVGGTAVTLTGTGFLGLTGVTFGVVPATSFTVVSDTVANAVAPPGTAGTTVGVTVTENGAGDVLPAAFGYTATPSAPTTATPATGPDSGGTPVVVTGTGFRGATAVTFAGVPGTGFLVVSDTRIEVVSPAGPVGTVPLAVVEGGVAAAVPGGFSYVGQPSAVTTTAPSSGPDAGGTAVTITGTGFTGATGVTFDGTPGTAFAVLSDTQITVTTPAGAAGPAAVVVVDAAGAGTGSFTYTPTAASIAGLTPVQGPDGGGTPVVVNGTGFTGATAVTFGGVAGTGLTVVSDTRITVTTPPGTVGPVDVRVVDAGGSDTLPGGFTYLGTAASPTSVTPASGTEVGGTVVTVRGSGLAGATGVSFGGVAGTGLTPVSDTELRVTTPPGTVGPPVDVVVTDPSGTGTLAGAFTYTGAPAAPTAISPATGPDAGGTAVTITGTGFTGATGVTFDGVPGTGFVPVSDTQVTVVTPPGVAGTADVTVLDTAGPGTLPAGFTYQPAGVAGAVLAPVVGPVGGGTTVTITGTGLVGVTSVTFGGAPGTALTVVDDTRLTVRTPAAALPGPVTVVIADPAGGQSLPAAFTYQGSPLVGVALSPTTGTEAGGETVTVTATSGLSGATGVTFGGVLGTGFVPVDDTRATVVTPAGVPGTVPVVVRDDGGDTPVPGGFTYTGSPAVIATVAPPTGPDAGGTQVRITGSGFSNATGVLFGATPGTGATVQVNGDILVTTPPGTAGLTVDVTVLDPSGSDTLPAAFTYTGSPAVPTAVTPASGPDSGGTAIAVDGSGFTAATGLTVGGAPATGFVVVSDTRITAVTPAGAVGAAVVAVVDAGGSTPLTGGFTYVGTPVTLVQIDPVEGPDSGGTPVTLTGSGFTGATAVTFGGAPGTITARTDTTLTVSTPPGTAGDLVDVTVVDPAGSDTLPGVFTYTGSAALPTGITPGTGPDSGGTPISITGTGFTGATGVTVGGVAATSVVVVSDTQVTALTPRGVVGPAVDVAVLDAPGSTVLPAAFTYTGSVAVPTALTPATGPDSGGTTITIDGSGFTGATGVTVAGVAATGVVVVSDTRITAVTPVGTVGPAAVVVLDGGGQGTVPAPFAYTASAATVTGVAPATGPDAGNTPLTITGTGFTGATGVTVGGTPAGVVVVVSDTVITATTPPGTAGPAAVVVLDGGGNGSGTFTYTPAPPLVAGLDPAQGPDSGGTPVTVRGSGFTGVTSVVVGTTSVPFTVVDDGTITLTTPRNAAGPGPVAVTVTDPAGSDTETFSYLGTPSVVTGLTPATGPDSGGQLVTLTGTGFTGATAVTFDGTPGTAPTVNSDTQITVTTPAGVVGPVDVVVVDAAGNGTAGYAYTGVPVAVTGAAPGSGPDSGGTPVVLTGSGFTGVTAVTVGGTAATHVVDSDGQLTLTTPPGTVGSAPIVVTDPAGGATVAFAYTPTPASVTTVSPSTGPDSGGTPITVTGSGFTGATGITVGGQPATGFVVDSDTQVRATTPPGVGVAQVVVLDPAGPGTGTFTYSGVAAAPASATPLTGPDAGGTVVTITGTGFANATGVTFGGRPGSAFSVLGDTQITVTTPPNTVGPAAVVVVDPAGDGPLAAPFDYVGAAAVGTSLTPTSGPAAGNTLVTVLGSGFTNATGVTFGGVPGTAFTVVSDTVITVRTPAGAEGTVPVAVLDPTGGSTVPGGFSYAAAPAVVTQVAPPGGPAAGGTPVTITGTGFTNATGVTFGGTPGTAFQVVSDTTITVSTPPGVEGAVDVVVADTGGAGTVPAGFTYAPAAAAITALTPASGPVAGNTPVTVTGTGFTGATAVTFDGVPGSAFTVVSDTRITVTTPAGLEGPADVLVTDSGGDGARPAGFTYVGAPSVVTSIAPATGPAAGDTPVTLRGTGFTNATAVTFDGVPGTAFTVVDDTTITVRTPAGVEGPADVVVTDGAGAGTLPAGFTYAAAPSVVASLAPTSGPATGNTPVTITGSGFTGATGVTFGGVPGTGFLVVGDTTITVSTPAGTEGPVAVVVLDPAGPATVPGGFTYDAQPAVVGSLAPGLGPDSGGTLVTVTGTGLLGATAVTVGGRPATDVTAVSATQLTFRTPPGTAGQTDTVVVVDAAGNGTGSFTYTGSAATVTALTPDRGPDAGGTPVTVTGSGFTGATGVTFDGVPGTGFRLDADGSISVTTPPGLPGPAVVVVVDAGGPGTGGYTYLAVAPVVAAVSPDRGPVAGGTTVTLTGTGFTGTTGVTVGGVPAGSVTVVSDTVLTLVVPPGAGEGPVDLVLTDTGGPTTVPGGFTYDDPAVLTSVTPVQGPDAGGTTVTVTGTGLLGLTSVTVGGRTAPVVSATSTQLVLTTPPGVAGPSTLALAGPAGGATADFRYLATAPVVTGVSPTTGPASGGTVVTITGSGLTGVTQVLFGGVPGTGLVVLSDTALTVLSPAGVTGFTDLVLVDTDGAVTLPDAFRYEAPAPDVLVLSSGGGGGSRPSALAWTGAPVVQALTLGSLVLLSGLVLLAGGRRRRS